MWRSASAVWLATAIATLIACAATAPALRPDSHDGGVAGDLDASRGSDVRDPADPAADRDGDGFPDRDDPCPDKPEDRDGFRDKDGCPELDNDYDHIPDAVDKCPNEPEIYNKLDDDDGCPDWWPVSAERRKLWEIHFARNQAAISPEMNAVLDGLAERAIAKKRSCQVWARAADDERRPVRLAGTRAAAVKKALLARGVPPEQISETVLTGAATECKEANEDCRRLNRRVTIEM